VRSKRSLQSGGPFWNGKPISAPEFYYHFVLGCQPLGSNGYYFVQVCCGGFKGDVELEDDDAQFLGVVERLEAVLKSRPAGVKGSLGEV